MKFPFFIFIYQVNALQKCKPDNASFHPLRSTTNNRLVFFRPPPQADTCPYGPMCVYGFSVCRKVFDSEPSFRPGMQKPCTHLMRNNAHIHAQINFNARMHMKGIVHPTNHHIYTQTPAIVILQQSGEPNSQRRLYLPQCVHRNKRRQKKTSICSSVHSLFSL